MNFFVGAKLLAYGINESFFGHSESINRYYQIVAVCDRDITKKDMLSESSIPFSPLEEIAKYDFDGVVVFGEAELRDEFLSLKPLHISGDKVSILRSVLDVLLFQLEAQEYESMNTREDFKIYAQNLYPVLSDKYLEAGTLSPYFYQDLWAAKKIFKNAPKNHYDIGSRVDGFISQLLSFRDEVTLIDIRPLKGHVEGLHFCCADATNLENIEDNSVESLSTLSAVEHFGLGRYGDPIDPEACFKAMKAIQRVLAKGGRLYFAVPVGEKDICAFNAHRIFNPNTILQSFDQLTLLEFSYVEEDIIHSFTLQDLQKNGEQIYAGIGDVKYGLFEYEKR